LYFNDMKWRTVLRSEVLILLKLDIIYQTLKPNHYPKHIYIITS
jgi:hypothetical protein